MGKKYAKNPSELVIDNPGDPGGESGTHRKNPKRVIAGLKGYQKKLKKKIKRLESKNQSNNKEDNDMSRPNPSDIADKGKDMVLKSVAAVGGSYAAAKGINLSMEKFGQNLPYWARKLITIGGPVTLGVLLAVYSKKKVLQDAATGMVIGGTSTGIADLFKAVGLEENTGMNDGLGAPLYSRDRALGAPVGQSYVNTAGELQSPAAEAGRGQSLGEAKEIFEPDNNSLGDGTNNDTAVAEDDAGWGGEYA